MASEPNVIPVLDRKGLREFGFTFGAIIAVLFGLLFPFLLDRDIPKWPWVILALFVFWALVAPMSLRPVYVTWMRFGLVMSRITTPLIMGLVFFLVVTPMGILKRLFGQDSMRRKWDESGHSYRSNSRKPPAKNLERPY